jgi:chlorophyll synthase
MDAVWLAALCIGGIGLGSGAALALAARYLGVSEDPRRHAPWYNATGTTLYVLGMLMAAFGVRALATGVAA